MSRPKSKFSEQCNRCGLCCSLEICEAGSIAFPGVDPPCPALVFDSDDFAICRLISIETSSSLDKLLAKALGIGCGCSMPDKDTTEEEIKKFDDKCRVDFPQRGNPWCDNCLEENCEASLDGTCRMIRIYLKNREKKR